jgi:hypothetical protein
VVASRASHHEVALVKFHGSRVVRWNRGRLRSQLSVAVGVFVVILGLFPAIDIDSDPATSNVPTAVLVVETRIPNEGASDRVEAERDAAGPSNSLKVFLRKLAESLNRGRQRCRLRVWSIRGP